MTKFKVNGENWVAKILTPKEMKKYAGTDGDAPAGTCEPSEKTIFINKEYVDYGTVAHEIFHAYFSGLHLENTDNISLLDLEEICATMFEKQGEKMVQTAKRVFKRLKKESE